ncbi:MAG: nucleoside permease [Candidatus Hydrogenedentota bacterium]
MNMGRRVQLSIMMFLEFFIWGAWVVTMGTYLGKGLGFSGDAIGWAYTTQAWAAIAAPFFVGMIADRFFNAERVLGIAHILGGIFLLLVTGITDPFLYFIVLLGHTLCYMPTLALVNAVSFSQMEDTEKEFPPIRVFGTIGWIVAGLTITFLLNKFIEGNVEATDIPLKMAGFASLVMGVYSFTLPKCPPKKRGEKVTFNDVISIDALRLMKDRSFAVFVISSLLICIPLAFYYAFANLFFNELEWGDVAAKMTIGQMSEVVFMLIMPFFFARLGVKKMLLVGMVAWVFRYIFFAYGNVDNLAFMLYLGIALHGICYDFFFVTGQIYVDKEAPEEVRASAQGLIALITYGVGMAIGNALAGRLVNIFAITNEEGIVVSHQWTQIWMIPCVMALVVAIGFALLFKEKPRIKEAAESSEMM